jgi:hypothetical protein
VSYVVRRTAMHVGTKRVADQFAVEWNTPMEEDSIASFWIGPRMPEAEAKARAEALAAGLNASDEKRKLP